MARPILIVFSPGETLKEFRLQTLADAQPVLEGIETFRVYATPVGRPTTQQMSAQVRIVDVIPQSISTQNISLIEGSYGTSLATFTVRLSAATALPVTVTYATRDGSATVANSDYVATSGTLTFRPGEITKTVAVTVNGDTTLESDELFPFNLTNPSRGATILTPSATCTILKDEMDVPGFQIDLTFGAGVTPAVMTAARAAATRWQQIISSDVPGNTTGGVFVDDITITVQMGLLGNTAGTDGSGGTLTNAGPDCLASRREWLAVEGRSWHRPCGCQQPSTHRHSGLNPISRITVAAFQDMGYAVNYSAADSYRMPGAAVATRSTAAVVGVFIDLQRQQLVSQVPAKTPLVSIGTATQAKIPPMQFAMIAIAERQWHVADRHNAPLTQASLIRRISTEVAGRTQGIALLPDLIPIAPPGY